MRIRPVRLRSNEGRSVIGVLIVTHYRLAQEFLQALRTVDAETAKAAGDLLAEVSRRRRSKGPPEL